MVVVYLEVSVEGNVIDCKLCSSYADIAGVEKKSKTKMSDVVDKAAAPRNQSEADSRQTLERMRMDQSERFGLVLQLQVKIERVCMHRRMKGCSSHGKLCSLRYYTERYGDELLHLLRSSTSPSRDSCTILE